LWAHEAWGLEDPPDAVTFSKKMQVAGYYTKKDLMPAAAYRVFNTWMGDPARMLMLEAGAYTRPLFSST
jgi:4-aminobutyrate aminotransferase/(S)-3-amino-2-methylpropionate transaminase